MLITPIMKCFLPCSEVVGEQYTTLYQTMKEFHLKLLSLGLRVLVYNGDTDMACNFLGDQWFVEDLGLKVGAPISGENIQSVFLPPNKSRRINELSQNYSVTFCS